MRSATVILLVTAILSSACARHVPEPAVAAPGVPYVSWIVMSGDGDNPDREFVCQSTPRSECVVPVSGPAEPVFSHVYVYYHGAGVDTRYAGSVQIGFFRGTPASNLLKTDLVVRKTESIANQSVSGIVTAAPGTYSIDFALVATATETKSSQPIRDQVRIVVK